MQAEKNGKIDTLLQLSVGTIEVDDKRYSIGLRDPEPVDGPTRAETATAETAAVPEAGEMEEASVWKG